MNVRFPSEVANKWHGKRPLIVTNHTAAGKKEDDGADGGGRTHTLLRVPDFESSASANSATSALGDEEYKSQPGEVNRFH